MADLPRFDTIDDYVTWAAEQDRNFNPHWCSRHWAPCPVHGHPGAVASIVLLSEALALVPNDVTTPDGINSWFENQTTPTCCKLGDDKMNFLWELMRRMRDGELCMAIPHPPTGRSCFYNRGHPGLHEFQRPLASIFTLMDR